MEKKLETNSTTPSTHFWKEKDGGETAQNRVENFGKKHPII